MFIILKNFCVKNEVSKYVEMWFVVVYVEYVLYL